MNKLTSQITKDTKDLKKTRAIMLAQDLEAEQVALIARLEREMRELESQRLSLLDFGPDNVNDLKVKSVNANAWVYELQDLKVGIENKKVELMVATETWTDLFEDAK